MTEQEMVDHLEGGPVPHRINPDGKLQVLDLTSLPGAWQDLFDAQGFFAGGDAPVEKPAEPGVVGEPSSDAHSPAEQAKEEAKSEDPKPLQGKLPEDFPGYSALDTAGIHTYAQLRNSGDVTEISGIGAVTAGKIEEALKG